MALARTNSSKGLIRRSDEVARMKHDCPRTTSYVICTMYTVLVLEICGYESRGINMAIVMEHDFSCQHSMYPISRRGCDGRILENA